MNAITKKRTRKLTDRETRIVHKTIVVRIAELERYIAEWDALPNDAVVDNFYGHAIAIAKEDVATLKGLVDLYVL